jgi:UDP-N-acetylmuramate dehydrogenase
MTWPGGSKCSVASRYPLSGHTTFRIGGPAEFAAKPRSGEEIAEVLRIAQGEGLPVRAVGAGANLLVADEGVAGLVLLMRGLNELAIHGNRVTAGAGVTNSQLLGATRARGLSGLACLVGYPGTVGGAVRMNAGGTAGYIGRMVEWVRGVDASGRIVERSGAECNFRYRGSDVADLVVVEVGLLLDREMDPEEYAMRCREVFERKRDSQPLELPSAGCVWKNPPGDAAGRLVDAAGCKGLRIGGAEVSAVHANFVVNRGGATCADVLTLMEQVRLRVHEQSGVLLQREVIHWGDAAVALSGR